MGNIGAGNIAIPGTWEVRTQMTYIEPPDTLKVPLAVQQAQAKPRANVVVSRSAATVANPQQALDEFYGQTAQAVPGLKRAGQGTVAFDDGVQGAWVTISFNATPQVRLAQRHFFRIDGDVLTQLVATVDESRIADLDGPMQKIVRTFKP